MKIAGSVVLVTGANRGIGRRVVVELLTRGARKVYAASRAPAADMFAKHGGAVTEVPYLDITRTESVAHAARECDDVGILINNAGVNSNSGVIAAPDLGGARAEMETNYFGTLSMCRAFAPVLAAVGGGMIVNVLSITARVGLPAMGSLCASKAAALRMTECVRAELAAQGTRVMAFLPAAVDTDMTRGVVGVVKESPEDAAKALCDGIERGDDEVLFGRRAQYVAELLRVDPARLRREYAAMLPRRREQGAS
jgi:NAD(P)-dependent dehydrogenase (short-subunit alcohol dehydrogenase family)